MICAPALRAQGGFTTVTGTITGAVDGIVWSCGSISAQLITAGGASATLNGGGFTTQTSPVGLGCPTSPGTGAPGSFAMRLADSGVINPSNTTWKFTINMTPGIAPPAGTGPQSFTFTSAINCSTNTPNTCTSNTIDISALLSALAPRLSNSGSGGSTSFTSLTSGTNTTAAMVCGTGCSESTSGTGTITATNGTTSVATLPGSATAGSSFLLPNGAVVTSQGGSVFTGGLENAIQPSANGVKMDTKMCRDANAQFTTTQNVTCLTATFTATDLTKAEFATCCGLNGGSNHPVSIVIVPQGTITVINSATNVTVSIAGTTTTCAAGGSGCLFLWGTDDSAAWDATWTAATGSAGHCSPIQMGGGMSFISSAKFLTTVCNTGITGPGSQGASIVGLGYKASQFVILPNFPSASCIGSGGGSCFGPVRGFQFINMGIWGGENGNAGAGFNGKNFVDVGIDSYLINVLFAGFNSGVGSMNGVQFETSGQTPSTMIVDGFGGGSGGGAACNIAGGNYNVFVESFCGNVGGTSVNIATGAILTSYGGLYGAGSNTNSTMINFGTFRSFGDLIAPTGSGGVGAALVVNANSQTYLQNTQVINAANAGSFALFFGAASAKVWSQNTTYQGGGPGGAIGIGTMGTFFDQGGNVFVTTPSAGTILPTCAESAGNGTCAALAGSENEKGVIRITAGTTTLLNPSFTMTFAGSFSGASASAPTCTFLVQNTGTGSWVTAAPNATGLPSATAISTASVTVGIATTVNTVSASTYDVAYTCVAK